MKVYIYSSGSVEAQKLLFGHSTEGDILEVGYLVSQFVCCRCVEYHDQSHLGRIYLTYSFTRSHLGSEGRNSSRKLEVGTGDRR